MEGNKVSYSDVEEAKDTKTVPTTSLETYENVADPLEKHENQHKTGDIALEMIKNFDGASRPPLDAATNKRLLWKADLYITLFLSIIYAVQYMDKLSNGAAVVMGIKKDLKMVGDQYSWVGSSFYLGYLIFELPLSYVIQRFPIAKVIAVMTVLWGVIMMCSAACQNYAGYITCRTLLGICESVVTPGFALLTAQWYRREEQFSRILFWCGFDGVGYIIVLAIGYGLYLRQIDIGMSIAGWRVLFLILGGMSIIFGVLFWFHVPDTPAGAWFLTEEEKQDQVERIRDNKQGFGNPSFKMYQFIEVFKDPRTYLYCAGMFTIEVPSGGLSSFFALIIGGISNDPASGSLLLSLPGGGAELVGCTINAVLAAYFFRNYRMVWGIGGALVSVLCLCLLAWGPNAGSQLAGVYIWYWSVFAAFVALLSSIASNTAGHTKKVTTSALAMIFYCVGSLVGPQTFKAREAPGYASAKLAMAICSIINAVIMCAILLLNIWENRRRDRRGEKLPPDMDNAEFADLTDFENPEFRYAY